MSLVSFLSVFFAYLIVDFAYASYIVACSEKRAIAASNWSMLLYVLSAFGLAVFVHNYWTVIPMAMGGWLGSYIVITRENKRGHKGNEGLVT